METHYLVETFELEAKLLDATLRNHPSLSSLFSRDFRDVDVAALKRAYLRLLKLKADYVQYTVPALRAAGEALRGGDDEDRGWSCKFLDYAASETDGPSERGHHLWARDDMRALGAPADMIDAPPHPGAVLYRRYFVEDVARHPYAILGAKGVLEHFAIRVSDDVARGIVESGVPSAENATTFFRHHGVLDGEHVRDGNRNVERLAHPEKRFQVLEGAYFTSGTYRALVHHLLPG
jgi:hypothetical protein